MQLSKTLSALALLGAVIPAAHALSIKDDVVKLGVGIRLQTRAQVSDATGTDGQEYRVQSGTLDAANDPIDFSIRRARLYLKIGYGENWKGEFAFNADNIDNQTSGTPNRNLQVRYAWAQRIFKLEGEGMQHAIAFGLMKPLANAAADASMSSSRALFPTESATAVLASWREVGLEWTFNHPMFLIALDLFQNESGSKVTTGLAADEAEGLMLGGRVEFSFSPEWFIAKRAESFLGKEGHGFNLGISAISNQDAIVDPAGPVTESAVTTNGVGVDALFWWNNLSAFFEYRTQTVDTEVLAGGSSDVTSEAIVAQAAWAFPLENGCVVEPALRFALIDNNTDVDETVNYGSNASAANQPVELGASGTQIDIGINYYLDGHNNKLQLAYQMWDAEEGEADASIIRLQHQLNF